ncbi:MAG: L,D-transpeptidase family protein [Mycobacterium sp.]|nr:L,D-transpeptidase family protein [Mycobacterium sp.]
MRRVLFRVAAAATAMVLAVGFAPVSGADTPWFQARVGNATQVLSVVGTGGSTAKMDVWQRGATGWQPVGTGIPILVGSAGMAPEARDNVPATPMGVYSLDFAFGTQPNPGGGLKYYQTTPDYWWSSDGPTYNTMQVCKKADCPFNTSPASGTENLYIPEYAHAIVMGVNKERIPGRGGAFFVHTSNGSPTAGCVALDDATLVTIIQWLQPGAVIAIAQ